MGRGESHGKLYISCLQSCLQSILGSKQKLTLSEHTQLESILEGVVYTCGASLEDLDLSCNLANVVVKEKISVEMPLKSFIIQQFMKIYASIVLLYR